MVIFSRYRCISFWELGNVPHFHLVTTHPYPVTVNFPPVTPHLLRGRSRQKLKSRVKTLNLSKWTPQQVRGDRIGVRVTGAECVVTG